MGGGWGLGRVREEGDSALEHKCTAGDGRKRRGGQV